MPRSLPSRKPTTPAFRPRVERLDDRINPVFPAGYDAISFADQQAFDLRTSPVESPGNPVATAVGDFDGDDKQDVAVLNGIGTVSILLNTTAAGATAATFSIPRVYGLPLGMSARAIAVGDLNLDGRPDIVAVGQSGLDGIVVGLMNTTAIGESSPTFSASDGRFPGWTPTAVALGDFDGDGRLDIATADGGSRTVTVVQNKTPMGGTVLALNPWLNFAAGPSPVALAVGDLNGDGRLDLATANANGTVSILLNQTPPDDSGLVMSSATVGAGLASAILIAADDFNNDGVTDLAVAGSLADGTAAVAVLTNRTRPGVLAFDPPGTYAVGAGFAVAGGLVVADFNADGLTDLAAATSGDAVSVLRNNGYGSGFRAPQVVAVGPGPVGLSIGDFNRDGRPDLVTANGNSNPTVSVLRSTSGAVSYPGLFGQFGPDLWSASAANETDAGWSQAWLEPRVVATGGTGTVAVAVSGRKGVHLDRAGLITTATATALAIDSRGRVWASFAGAGVGVYDPATRTWAGLPGTAATADLLAVSANGDVFANFVGYGVYRYRSVTGWQQINGHDATSLNVDANGSVVANFAGVGVGQYIAYAHGWRLIANREASAITVDAAGILYASVVENGGISRWSPTGVWTPVVYSAPAVSLVADATGHFYGSFPGYGVLKFTPGVGWTQVRATDASSLFLGDIWFTDTSFPVPIA